ncbi:hypothetical protein C8J57DRAFT_1508941 [Mycena rebaudengoi]|nr:hypothetical protein C8J57DRAFT_1508941 [Mycena rebaudengoi]
MYFTTQLTIIVGWRSRLPKYALRNPPPPPRAPAPKHIPYHHPPRRPLALSHTPQHLPVDLPRAAPEGPRLVYQSRKRGTLESDLILSMFAREHLGRMDEAELLEGV